MRRFFRKRLPAFLLTLVMVMTMVPAVSAKSSADLTYEVDKGDSVSFKEREFRDLYRSEYSGDPSYVVFTDYSDLDDYGYLTAVNYYDKTVSLSESDLRNTWFYYDSHDVPKNMDYALDGLTFEANRRADSGTLRLKFEIYDADGKKILNYEVNFTYEVDPEFSAAEDFPPGKYVVDESGAASSMLKIVKEAFEGDFSQYLKPGKKLKVVISGTADATPIIRTIPYNGMYGDFVDEPIYENGELTAITVTKADGVKENRQLAFLRAEGVKDYLQKNVEKLKDMDADYTFKVDVSEGKGSEFRRITANFTIMDVFE